MKRSTKHSLIMSALSLLLCASMLIGTTFAWFTDSVTSTNNIIKSGNLDVEMYWAEGDENPSSVTWKDASAGAIFNNEKWEPGYVEAKHIKIANEGSLAFKYKLYVVPNGTVDILADVIDVYYIEGAKQLTRTDLAGVAPVGTLRDMINEVDGAAHGTLLPVGETATSTDERVGEVTATIAFKMREGAGNEYMNKSIGTNFSIQLLAIQYTFEDDSFDNQYDVGAPEAWMGETDTEWYLANPASAEFEIKTAEELAGLAAIVNGTAEGVAQDSFSGQTIKLASDIDLGNLPWDTIGRNHDDDGTDPFKGTFDGQGYTVYNLNISIEDNKRDSVGFIGYANNAKIKGLTIQNVSINADYFVGAIVGKLVSGEIFDCHVKGDINIVARRNYAAGIVGDGYYTMENCSVTADETGYITSKAVAGGLCGRISEGSHTIKNCVVKNMDIQSGQQIAAISGFVHYGNTIEGCVAENVKLTLTATSPMKPAIGLASGLWYYKYGAPVTIRDNVFKNITVDATADATGTTNILYGWEWSDHSTGVVENNNITDNITNNLNYV